ncbi:FAST kinase domain-containing protein 2, mitochondrial [Myxocyprinus asiaticus]|uniref:FAST kinase domain-containing protein 2, mitochondrial n=1 Tax=Myxocyprinus asiaticus TaxID=70543 RepID=UPI0022222CE1|nr:FAST kinase domain-containing protein 2, mitochondrial [Myxocyprinus asiaticus]
MRMYKSGVEMLGCALRSISLWKCDSFIRTQTVLHYKRRSFAVSTRLGRKTIHTLERVRFYTQGSDSEELLNVQMKQAVALQSTAKGDASELPSDKPERAAPFYTHIQDCFSPTDVLDTLKRFPAPPQQQQQQHISSAFTRMWESMKKMTDEQRRYELRLMFEHPAFEELCDQATTNAWRMRSEDLAYSLLAIVKLGVSQNTRVVQTLLRVIQERLIQFDERSLSVLAGCIRDMDNSKNIQALRDALRLLLKDRIPEIQSVVVLQSMMQVVGKDSPTHLKKKLAMKALSMADKFSPPNTQYMFFSLAAMSLNFKPLLDVCSKKIAENVHEYPFSRLLAVLKSCHELHYRNFTLFSSVSEYVSNTFDMWSNKQVILFLLTFEELAFRPVALLDAFTERIMEKSDSLTLRDVLSVLKVFSLLSHDLKDNRQQFLNSITKVLESYFPKISMFELLKAVHYLGILDHFPQTALEKLLHHDTLEQLLQRGRQSDKVARWLQTLDLCLRLDGPHLPPTLMSIPDLQITVPAHELTVNQEVLCTVRGIMGSDAVQDSVLEQGVYFIDCVITQPHPHTKDCGSPECIRRIAVVCAPPASFCFGTTHPRASLAVKLRHLRKLHYEPVLVPVHEFSSQTEQEKIKMLQNLILPGQESSETQEIQKDHPTTQ